jgi:ATP-dependent DNA helicase Q5
LAFLLKQDIFKLNKNEAQAKAILENFEAMVKFCEQAVCRHNYFAKYFGDEALTSCGKMCDACADSKEVGVGPTFYSIVVYFVVILS